MAITAAMVKELRERTGAGMMECKKVLQTVEGDIEQAIEAMRKAGQAKADKKAGRMTAEGVVLATLADDQAIMLEINSETDFVARDENFITFSEAVIGLALGAKVDDAAQLLDTTLDNGESVEVARRNLVATVGENINLRRLARLAAAEGEHIGCYNHGGKIGVLVRLRGGNAALAKDIAMHIAASNPLVVRADELDQAVVEKEKAIYQAQAADSGKPEAIIEKMIQGKLAKYIESVSLYGQAFVKNPDQKIRSLLEQEQAEVVSFVRFQLGEGLEKKTESFADEVRAQARGHE